VLFISPDAVGERMAGMGIRYTELARVLAAHADVVLASGGADDGGAGPGPDGVRLVRYAPHAPAALRPEIAAADVIVAPPQWPVVAGWMRRSGARLIFDLYAPETLETLELFAERRPLLRRLMVALTVDRLQDALSAGHHFMCAGAAQRDLYVGALLASRRLDPATYDRDPSLRALLDVVPFGVPEQSPRSDGGAIRAAIGQIAGSDEVVLWNGGLWNWLDAPTAIHAVARLAERRPAVRLVFMGTGTGPAGAAAAAEAHALAASLALLGDVVHFNEGWVPYAERGAWLLDADCAIATARDHLETRFAFRTRVLDCFWAGLPIVCTRGDELAARIERDDLGALVAPADPAALADALECVLDRGRPAFAVGLARAAADHAWSVVAEPLVVWVTSAEPPAPRPAAGVAGLRLSGHSARRATYRAVRRALQTARVDWPSL
jgi:glycosyltransferase involved in cell wall biosynthesis